MLIISSTAFWGELRILYNLSGLIFIVLGILLLAGFTTLFADLGFLEAGLKEYLGIRFDRKVFCHGGLRWFCRVLSSFRIDDMGNGSVRWISIVTADGRTLRSIGGSAFASTAGSLSDTFGSGVGLVDSTTLSDVLKSSAEGCIVAAKRNSVNGVGKQEGSTSTASSNTYKFTWSSKAWRRHGVTILKWRVFRSQNYNQCIREGGRQVGSATDETVTDIDQWS